jgi:dihydropteroate synthase
MYAATAGVWGVRVHEVPSTLDAMRVAAAIEEAE